MGRHPVPAATGERAPGIGPRAKQVVHQLAQSGLLRTQLRTPGEGLKIQL